MCRMTCAWQLHDRATADTCLWNVRCRSSTTPSTLISSATGMSNPDTDTDGTDDVTAVTTHSWLVVAIEIPNAFYWPKTPKLALRLRHLDSLWYTVFWCWASRIHNRNNFSADLAVFRLLILGWAILHAWDYLSVYMCTYVWIQQQLWQRRRLPLPQVSDINQIAISTAFNTISK